MTQPNTKPHTKVHVSVAYHHKTSDIWADLRQRGMLVEVWRLAVERYAAKRNDTLALRPLDRQSIVTDRDAAGADADLITLFKALRYPLRRYPNRWELTIRNLSKKHGFWSRDRSPITSGSGLHKIEEIREKKEEEEKEKYKDSGTPPSASGASAVKANGKARKKTGPDPRAVAAWPAIRAAFESHGKHLSESIGPDRAAIITKRLDEGATESDLVAAVHGYVKGHGGLQSREGFDPGQFFRPSTVFKAEGFSDRVDAGSQPGRSVRPSLRTLIPNMR